MEPGRSMVATAGLTLYSVGSMKDVPGLRKYVAVDGGLGDNIRPALYQAQYTAIIANKVLAPVEETVTLVGKYCESGDVLIKNLPVPRLDEGDVVAVFGTGAYNYSMASNYNRFPRPAMILVENGKAHMLVQRETYDTLIQQDLIPNHLRQSVDAAMVSPA
jgi:diaminopimelate decarboxylase